MRVGYDGLINEAKDKLSKLSMRDPEYNDKRDFYEAMIIMHEAAKTYIERYASLCEEKAKEDSSIQTFQIDEEAFLYLNFNETPQPSLRELEKMVKEIQVAEVNEEEEEKETDQQPDMLQDV